MSKVQQLEREVERLSPQDFDELASWIEARRQKAWTDQMERDSAGGKLDLLFEEADAERAAGTLHDWPPREK